MDGDDNRALRQRVLEAVTDSALAELELEKLLDVLLHRVQDLFGVDTVTVLLLDNAGEYLVATAAAGLEEEVFQGVRVPVGSGFAGRVAARREPVIIERVGPSTVVNPLLWERGLRVLLGVPMVGGGQVIGVLHIGSVEDRKFSDADVGSLQLVADRLALAAHAHRSRSERTAATLLQASLLPSHLPVVPGWELAARYVPGTDLGVGGDWYDVFPLPGGRLGLAIGDVVGNGLAAAVVMGRLRSALRAYALEFPDPADVLARVDRKASHFEHNTMATIGYGVLDDLGRQLRIALAGHLPPVLALPDRPAVYPDLPLGPPVGLSLATEGRESATIDVPPGVLIALFTDGLVERRDVSLDERMDFLLGAVKSGPPDAACARIMAEMVGNRPANDDIALLVARHMPD
jgi:sigma-B regulation protein RsbU (phosphoserine phosphatase)